MRAFVAAVIVAGSSLTGCAMTDRISQSEAHNYAVLTHASTHINPTRGFNEVNPGLGLGSEAPIKGAPYVVGVEAGRFLNSLDEQSSYAGAYVERDVLSQSAPGRLKLGAFFAYAEYPSEVQKARDRGFVVLGDFIPIAGLQATIPTIGPHEFRVRVTPGLTQADGIVTLQSNLRF